jgi:hypothetical protein
MSRPPRVSTADVLNVARSHFIKRGHSVSVKSIADDLGLSHSALIQRFGSKRALLISALRPPNTFPWSEGFLFGPPTNEKEAIRQLGETCCMLMTFLHENMPLVRILHSAGVTPDELFKGCLPLPLLACKRMREWIDRGIQRGLFPSCDSSALASTIVGAMFARAKLITFCNVHNAYVASLSTADETMNDHITDEERAMASFDESSLLGTIDGVIQNFVQLLLPNHSIEQFTDRTKGPS